jgi:uncharacterized protein (DUF736 family)
MIIGKFQYEDGVYVGSVPAFTGPSLPIRIAPTVRKGIDYAVTLAGSGIELGVAWKRTSSKGKEYVSVKLDSPFLPAPANCALVKQPDGFALLWNRKTETENEEEAA